MNFVIAFMQILMIMVACTYSLLLFERSHIISRLAKKKKLRKSRDEEHVARANVPVRMQVDPIHAYKRAYILDSGEFAGLGYHDRYKPRDKAICRHQRIHDSVPSLSCTCGFWGLTDPKEAIAYNYTGYLGLLEVEFFGEVLHLEKGYRAEQQRILSIQFDRRCQGCGINLADKLTTISTVGAEWKLQFGPIVHYVAFSHISSFKSDSPYMQFCSKCLKKFDKFPAAIINIRQWSLSEIANKFKVEVNWMSDELMEHPKVLPDEFKPHLIVYAKNPSTIIATLTGE